MQCHVYIINIITYCNHVTYYVIYTALTLICLQYCLHYAPCNGAATGEKTEKHNNTSTHKESMSKLEEFRARFSNLDLNGPFSFDNER